jgi:gluconate 2-dehydrogenase gamma chain
LIAAGLASILKFVRRQRAILMPSRRQFLFCGIEGISGVWIVAHWPAALAAAQHAHQVKQSGIAASFEFFSPEMAVEVESIAARVIPTDETPGASEAGVVYFIDRALVTFAKDDRKLYAQGIADVQAKTREMFPGVERFSAASQEQQDKVLRALDDNVVSKARPFVARPAPQSFFETVRQHTLLGFLIDPDSDRRGNRGGIGWHVIGRERDHMFQPSFGHYDKDYPGWQPDSPAPQTK